MSTWTPPFRAREPEDGMLCPVCSAEAVCVREHEHYLDASDYEAFCSECHSMLTVWASVDIAFSDVEAVPPPEPDYESELPTGGVDE